MKKRILAIGVAGLTGTAAAQAKTELFGVIDTNITRLKGSDSSTKIGLATGGANINRLGFRGTEDLGGGLTAGFWLEAGFNSNTGTGKAPDMGGLAFNRRSTLSLLGRFGEVRLGRDDAATFLNTLIFDPFLTNGVGGTNAFAMLGIPGAGTVAGGAPIQLNNALSYYLPSMPGGLYGQAQLAMSGKPDNAPGHRQGDYRGMRLGFRQGAWHGAVATGKLYGDTSKNNVTAHNAGLSYDFGGVRPMLLWANERRGGLKITAWQAGLTAALGRGQLRTSVGIYNTAESDADWRKFSLGYGYNLTTRTQVYGSLAYLKNQHGSRRAIHVQGMNFAGTALGGTASGMELGIRHLF